MGAMEPLRTYDYLTRARARIFDWVRPLDADQYARVFPIGLGSLARTLTHIMICEWLYVQRMLGRPVPPYKEWPIRDEEPPPFAALETTWTAQAAQTLASLAAVRDWTTDLEYRVTADDGAQKIISASPSDIFTQLVLHEVHHRAQTMNMLRHLGIAAEDIDFNTLMYKRPPASP
jgi:uncharacterized damage-inducible protein DinB